MIKPGDWLSPDQVCELIPGMTKNNLSQLRFQGTGPRYSKPSGRKIFYSREGLEEWLKANERTKTRD